MTDALAKKDAALRAILADCQRAVLAFSGGVDSTLLLFVAASVLKDRLVAVTLQSPLYPERELAAAVDLAAQAAVRHQVIVADELALEGFADNPPDRCYLCKRALFTTLTRLAAADGAIVLDGSNLDDDGDYRPGRRALAELAVLSPLHKAGFTKADIRTLSKEMGLPTAGKPALACLASRVPYGEHIDSEVLARIESAENWLFKAGFTQLRVRIHTLTAAGNASQRPRHLARIEIEPAEMDRLLDPAFRLSLVAYFKQLGFSYVTFDAQGYRIGSNNEVLPEAATENKQGA